jgi:diguanylate cyclase (GGDEF)-like protein
MTEADAKPGFQIRQWRMFIEALRTLPRRLKISQLLFASHLLLVIWLIGAMSYNRYQSEWQTRVDHSVEVAHLSMNPIIADLSLYASGLSYANINLPKTRKLFADTEKLLYFQVSAVSDYSLQPFHFAYSRKYNEVWQTGVTKEEVAQAYAKVKNLEALLSQHQADQVKYTFLLNRARERYQSIVADRQKAERFQNLYQRPELAQGKHVLNEQSKTLHIQLPLRNKGGGEVWAVFDAGNLISLHDQVLLNIAKEALLASVISIILILWATHWIVRPLRRLAVYMDHEVHELDVTTLPELNRDDEIGLLARCFRDLIYRIRQQIADLERLAVVDSLTGLGSRRYYETSGSPFLKQIQRNGHCLGMLVCDVDKFKLFNDHYGHAQGDKALRLVGQVIRKTFHRETDLAFRVGGEEFVVLIQVNHPDEVKLLAQRLRKTLMNEKMEHSKNVPYGVLTLSIGSVALTAEQARQYKSLDTLFEQADKALYQAKTNGRNRIEQSSDIA